MSGTGSVRLSASEGRRFGLTVGSAFVVIATLTWFRGHQIPTTVFGALGAALALAGLAVPAHLGPVQRGWMALAHAISKVTTPVVMGAMYLLVLFPIGVLRRTIGSNPLVHAPQSQGFWKTKSKPAGSMRRQF